MTLTFQSLQQALTLEEHRRLTADLSRPLTDPHMHAVDRAAVLPNEQLTVIDVYARTNQEGARVDKVTEIG